MNSSRIQLFFILGVMAITLHFSILFGKELTRYLLLNGTTSGKITQWEIIPIGGRFALKADYTFKVQEKNCSGSFLLNPPYYLNEIAALAELKKKAKQPWPIHYRTGNPQISALEKSFPLNLLFRFACCIGVVIYLFFIKYSLKKKLASNF